MKQKTAQVNQIRGLLMEYGVVIPQGIKHMEKFTETLEKNEDKLTQKAITVFKQMHEQFKNYGKQIALYDKEIAQDVAQNSVCKEVMKIGGVGPITASAIVASRAGSIYDFVST